MNYRISAVVVTFNRLELLKDTISGLRNQSRKLEAIIVVNNSSTDGTSEWLDKQEDIQTITQPNLGSSGGQYTAFQTAFEQGYDLIWTMDDDVFPDESALEKLLEEFSEKRIHTPLRFSPDGTPFYNDTLKLNMTNPFKSIWTEILSEKHLINEFIPCEGMTFEGPLFHRSLIEAIGLPEKKFFIYGDDTEYWLRAKKAGFEGFIVRDSKMYRKYMPVEKYAINWKSYYELRNVIAKDVLHGNFWVRTLRPFGYLLSWIFEKCRDFKSLKTAFKSFFDGYFYKSEN